MVHLQVHTKHKTENTAYSSKQQPLGLEHQEFYGLRGHDSVDLPTVLAD